MPMRLNTILFMIISAALLILTQCQSPDKDKKEKDEGFNPDLSIPFGTASNHAKVMVLTQNDSTLHPVMDEVLKAAKNGDLKAYQSYDLAETVPKEALAPFDGMRKLFFKVTIDWQVVDSLNYARPKAKVLGQTLKKKDGQEVQEQPFFVAISDLNEVLNNEKQQLLNQAFFEGVIQKNFRSYNKENDLSGNGLNGTLKTVRYMPWQIFKSPARNYINQKQLTIHQKLHEKVVNGELQAYKSAALAEPLSQSEMDKACQGDSVTTRYRPQPVQRPGYARDTVIVEECKPERVSDYMVVEQWHVLPDEIFGYQSKLKGLAPVIFGDEGDTPKRVYYWLKWQDVKDQLSKKNTIWLKKYSIFNQKNTITSI